MEPNRKKLKITDHFRVALKPQNINIQALKNTTNNKQLVDKEPIQQQQQQQTLKKIPVITIDDQENKHHDEKNVENEKQHLAPELITQPKRISSSSSTTSGITITASTSVNRYITPLGLKPPVVDHDKFLIDDVHCEPHYAWESFQYDREQEIRFKNRRYFTDETAALVRARLVDWLAHLQNTFALFHETLYMAVKLADQYQMRKPVRRKELQLLYMTCTLVASKFEERVPPIEISDLLQQSGNIYTRKQITLFELDLLKTLDFKINYPSAYGFLRRFARCTGTGVKTLTLARYILESSLLDDEMIDVLESKKAAAALLLAFKMQHMNNKWDETALFYTGYKQEELSYLTIRLNNIISRPTDKRLSTIRTKYTHEVFSSVAKISPL